MKQLRTLALAGLLVALMTANAAASDTSQAVCAARLAQSYEAPAVSGPLKQEQLDHCDVAHFYYGFDAAPDDAAALRCALHQRAHPSPGMADIFAGPGVLSMLYANGRGVVRNIDLAERFVCENPWTAQAELELRLEQLETLRLETGAARPFDLCDTATSGLSAGFCAGKQARFDDARRARELAAIKSAWTPAARQAFVALQAAYAAFADTRFHEIERSGTARNMLVIEDQQLQQEQLLINLRNFARSDLPLAGAADAGAAEREMARSLDRIQAAFAAGKDFGTIKLDGIQQTQAAWLKAREVWLDFAAVAWPGLNQDRLRTRLTRQRLHQLQSLERFIG